MPLLNFGSILGFAAELESSDHTFYMSVAANPACNKYKNIFNEFAEDEKKNEKTVLRVRQENVTEMILEPIKNLMRAPFISDREGADTMNTQKVLETAIKIEEKAERFYRTASEKVNALPEVSRTLKKLAQRRSAHRTRLNDLLDSEGHGVHR